MQTKVIRIGNSKGIRLSKTLLEKYNIGDFVEIIMASDHLKIKSVPDPRAGWDNKFKEMAKSGDDALFMDDIFENEEFEEWN